MMGRWVIGRSVGNLTTKSPSRATHRDTERAGKQARAQVPAGAPCCHSRRNGRRRERDTSPPKDKGSGRVGQKNGVDHMDHTVGLIHVGDGDGGHAALLVFDHDFTA